MRLTKRAIALLVIALLGVVAGWILQSREHRAGPVVSPPSVTLAFVGDCTFGSVNGDSDGERFPAIYRRSGDPDYPFSLTEPLLATSELAVANFECTLTNVTAEADKQWHFKGTATYAGIFGKAHIGAVTLANNHSFDYRKPGFDDTVAAFRKANVATFYQNMPYVTRVDGVETVLIGDCSVVGENTTRLDGVRDRVAAEIRRYKRPDNIVVVFMHWGGELDTEPRAWQQAMGHAFINAGADAVVGCHPHVLQGIEIYRNKCVAYSLGNFAFGGNSLARYPETMILKLQLSPQNTTAGQSRIDVVPCLTTSTSQRNAAGVLVNNYRPMPATGPSADRIATMIEQRSAGLKYGIRRINRSSDARGHALLTASR